MFDKNFARILVKKRNREDGFFMYDTVGNFKSWWNSDYCQNVDAVMLRIETDEGLKTFTYDGSKWSKL